jgi:hypothetical protein
MTNKEYEAYEMFEQFIKFCEDNNLVPQYIMMRVGSDQFWKTLNYFLKYNKNHVDTD